MKIPGVPFHPAHSSNYTKGRPAPVDRITIHHSAGWEQTLRYLWADPNRNGSSHFWVGNKPGAIEQYVDTDDTAWTNGKLSSNQRAVTIEVRGDWRGGFFDQTTLNNLEKILQPLRKRYPNARITYHMDETASSTLCPADLKHKSYARQVWDRVTKWLNPPTPAPAPKPQITYRPITPKRIELKIPTRLWNFNAKTWEQANKQAIGQPYPAGYLVDVVAIGRNQLGGEYYMTAYSYNGGKIRATNGFNVVDAKDYVPKITQPPTVVPKWEPMATVRKLRAADTLRVINLDTMEEIGDPIPEGKDIEFVEKKTLKDNRMYLRSKWAKTESKNWGIPIDLLEEIKDVPREPIPEPPIDVDPETPGDADMPVDKNAIIAFLEMLGKLISEFLTKLKGTK